MSMQLELRTTRDFSSGLAVVAPPAALRRVPLHEVLAEVAARVAPLWPLNDYVAVNPFGGWADTPFLLARQQLVAVRDCDLLPSREYFQQLLGSGRLTPADLAEGFARASAEYPDWYEGLDRAAILRQLSGEPGDAAPRERRYFAVSELIDQRTGSTWTSHILNDITRCCGAHLDEGQALWASPWQGESVYQAWRKSAAQSRRMDWLGLKGFREFVAQLPGNEIVAIEQGLRRLSIPDHHQASYLLCLLYSVAGWGSYFKYQSAWREERRDGAGGDLGDLPGLLAIRLAYDVALAADSRDSYPQLARESVPDDRLRSGSAPQWDPPSRDVLARYVLQLAAEGAYRRRLISNLSRVTREGAREPRNSHASAAAARRSAQVVFCIDVRSEIMRRHLEEVAPNLETWGFAGFFGMALRQVGCGDSERRPQCPVLLRPGFEVREKPRGGSRGASERIERRRERRRREAEIWKSFQTSPSSCFSFVESWGLSYLGKLWARSGWSELSSKLAGVWRRSRQAVAGGVAGRSAPADHPMDLELRDPELRDLELLDLHEGEVAGPLGFARKLQLAEGLLRNLGLLDGFARLVVFCGHTAEVENNPYQAAMACGACGGHSGEINARVAARLLNDVAVRSQLAAKGIAIPADTWFVAAVHNTTTDEIRCCDREQIPSTHAADLQWFEARLEEAAVGCRAERARRLEGAGPSDLRRRSRDWSEVRPEWGLADNACFIAAPRANTAGLDLGGRSFLHSYQESSDPTGSVLELIMTAPLVVANWINLQYFGSTIDNRAFGSGNKTLHNLVGRFGVLSGNGGDLMTGLPWQSVHDGRRWQHEPLRLTAIVAAARAAIDRVVDQHPQLRELLAGGWLALIAWESEGFFEWSPEGWHRLPTGDAAVG